MTKRHQLNIDTAPGMKEALKQVAIAQGKPLKNLINDALLEIILRSGRTLQPANMADRNAAIVQMRRDGAKYSDIAGRFGISMGRVAHILKAHGMTADRPRAAPAPRLLSSAAQRAADIRAKWAAIAAQNVSH